MIFDRFRKKKPVSEAKQEIMVPQQDGILYLSMSEAEPVTVDLNKAPHILIADESDRYKQPLMQYLTWQAMKSNYRIYMVDILKGGVVFGKKCEQYGEVILIRERALEVFKMLEAENTERLRLFREAGVRNLPEYNQKTGRHLCRVVVVIEELLGVLYKTALTQEEQELVEQTKASLTTLARLSRAAGINLLIGVQYPDALPSSIKNNVPARVCGRFADCASSEIVLGNKDAMYLDEDRFLFRIGKETKEFQGFEFDIYEHLDGLAVAPGEMLSARDSYTEGVKAKLPTSSNH